MERTMKLYWNKVYGEEVSKYGLENGYLDYLTLLIFIRITLSQSMVMSSWQRIQMS